MQQISLSVFNHGGKVEPQTILMRSLLDAFEREQHIHVDLEVINWNVGWARLVEMAIYGRGPDVSEVGSTWVMDLVRMNALNHFSALELGAIGNEKDFVPANWNACITPGSGTEPAGIWGVPWSADVRLIFYRRDLLEQAEIDPHTAFEHIDVFKKTVAILKARGQELPISFSTFPAHNNIHYMASWIWDAGGDFMTPDDKRVAFDDPKALRGMHYYFGLGRYIPQSHRRISDQEVDQLFLSGRAAAVLNGSWILGNPGFNNSSVRSTLGLASMPGASFIGGSHLVAWKHSLKKEAALALVNFITKHSENYGLFPAFGLPAYLPNWDKSQFLEEPYFSTFQQALQKGRSFPSSELWGLVEKRLADVVPSIWEKVLDSNEQDVDGIVAEKVLPLARKLNTSLETS